MLATYDEAKHLITSINGDNFGTTLMASATAGFACSFTSLPFDLLKTRVMNMAPGPDGSLPYKGIVDCTVKIAKTDGILSLWRGFTTYYFRCAPHAMIILIVIEELNFLYEKSFRLKEINWKKYGS